MTEYFEEHNSLGYVSHFYATLNGLKEGIEWIFKDNYTVEKMHQKPQPLREIHWRQGKKHGIEREWFPFYWYPNLLRSETLWDMGEEMAYIEWFKNENVKEFKGEEWLENGRKK